MRTPLTIIKGYLEFQELSAGSLSPKDLQKQAAVMKKHLARMENYIEAMNSLATPDGIGPSPSLIRPSWRRSSSVQQPCSANGFTSPLSRNRSFPDLLSADPEIISCSGQYPQQCRRTRTSCAIRFTALPEAEPPCWPGFSDDSPGFSTAALEKGCDPFFTGSRGQRAPGTWTLHQPPALPCPPWQPDPCQ